MKEHSELGLPAWAHSAASRCQAADAAPSENTEGAATSPDVVAWRIQVHAPAHCPLLKLVELLGIKTLQVAGRLNMFDDTLDNIMPVSILPVHAWPWEVCLMMFEAASPDLGVVEAREWLWLWQKAMGAVSARVARAVQNVKGASTSFSASMAEVRPRWPLPQPLLRPHTGIVRPHTDSCAFCIA